MYVPEIVVTTDVQIERMTKAYHRKWYLGHGKSMAVLRLNEVLDHHGRLLKVPLDSTKLFGAPLFVYRALLGAAGRWLRATVQRSESLSFQHETQMIDLVGYILKCYEPGGLPACHSSLLRTLEHDQPSTDAKSHGFGAARRAELGEDC